MFLSISYAIVIFHSRLFWLKLNAIESTKSKSYLKQPCKKGQFLCQEFKRTFPKSFIDQLFAVGKKTASNWQELKWCFLCIFSFRSRNSQDGNTGWCLQNHWECSLLGWTTATSNAANISEQRFLKNELVSRMRCSRFWSERGIRWGLLCVCEGSLATRQHFHESCSAELQLCSRSVSHFRQSHFSW